MCCWCRLLWAARFSKFGNRVVGFMKKDEDYL
jgi:hypothetical protein